MDQGIECIKRTEDEIKKLEADGNTGKLEEYRSLQSRKGSFTTGSRAETCTTDSTI